MRDVIVIGFSYTTVLGVVRSLGEAGFRIKLITFGAGHDIIAASKYVVQALKVKRQYDLMYQAMEELRGDADRILVVPVQDWACLNIDQHAEELTKHYDFPCALGEIGGLSRVMDKGFQKQLAMECGITVAKGSEFPTTPEGIERAKQSADFPCLIKPARSAEAYGSKQLITPCKDADELEEKMILAREAASTSVVVEKFLDIEEELCAYGFAVNGKAYIPAYIKAVSSGVGPHKGIAAEGVVEPIEDLGELKGKLELLAEKSKLNGLFCMDLLVSEGKIHFSEMNTRCGASEYAVTRAGANLPGAFVAAFYGETPDLVFHVRAGSRYVNEKVVVDSYRGGHISFKECIRAIWKNEIGFVKNREDPAPWKRFLRLLVRKTAARILKGPQD